MKHCYLIAFFAVVAGFFSAPPVRAVSPDSAVIPFVETNASKDLAFDLGDGVKMEFVWIQALNGWVGKYEVTNGEYRKFKAGHHSGDKKEHSLNEDRQPVVGVNLSMVKSFADWLTKREKDAGRLPEGYRFRLPSEDEWLTFAQCGDGRAYPWGNTWPPKYGNYGDEKIQEIFGKGFGAISGYRDGYAVSCPVEESGKNDWGLYGVGGNVYEITAKGKDGASFGALRGSSWQGFTQNRLSCSFRLVIDASALCDCCGFRLVLFPASP